MTFRQASLAQRITVACNIAFKRLDAEPTAQKLKIMRMDDAEHLDAESEALLLRLAKERGVQCFLAFVRDVDVTDGPMVSLYDEAA